MCKVMFGLFLVVFLVWVGVVFLVEVLLVCQQGIGGIVKVQVNLVMCLFKWVQELCLCRVEIGEDVVLLILLEVSVLCIEELYMVKNVWIGVVLGEE